MSASVQNVIRDMLCCGCGACAEVCPRGAISLAYTPSGFLKATLAEDKCIECGKCARLCPGAERMPLTLTRQPRLVVSGHATDAEIWRRGQSGGLATALLCALLKNDIVDGAIVTRMEGGIPQAIYTEDVDAIQSAAGSVYAQTSVAREVLRHSDKRIAAVALGCQARAIRRAMELYPKQFSGVSIIGLICGGNMSLLMKEKMLQAMGVHEPNLPFRYRDKLHTPWPGDPTCETADGLRKLTKEYRMALKPAYECYRCAVCPDKMNVCADVVLGDPWGIEEDEVEAGMSVALAYTQRGAEALELSSKGEIEVHPVEHERILMGQKILTDYAQHLRKIPNNREGMKYPYLVPEDQTLPMDAALLARLRYDRRFYSARNRVSAISISNGEIRRREHRFRRLLHEIRKFVIRTGPGQGK